MKTISDYTIYCTESQIKRALELGAEMEYAKVIDTIYGNSIRIPEETGEFYQIPTAEQMLGWLRTECVHLTILYSKFRNLYSVQCVEFDGMYIRDDDGSIKYFISDKEATLAAIDAALDYLTNNKK